MPPSQRLSEEEFDAWKHHPITVALFAWLAAGREASKEDFIRGNLTLDREWASGMNQAMVIGRCEMAQTILDLEFNQLGQYDAE
jgi:hypothetical protein